MPDDREMGVEHRKQIIEIWKTTIDVQQHFNDIGMRIRSMFITILLALFASIGFILDKKLNIKFFTISVQFSTLIPLFGFFVAYLFYFIDRYWYHRLLTGSVKHALSIENKYKDELPELSLSDTIGAESPYEPQGVVRWLANRLVRHDEFRKTGKMHSDAKIEFFYKTVMLALIMLAIVLSVSGGIVVDTNPQPTAVVRQLYT